MYKQRPVRDAKGKVLFEQYQSSAAPNTRIVPDRRWFGNTRVVGQAALEAFRVDMAAKSGDAYNVLLKHKNLPLALLEDSRPAPTKRQAASTPSAHQTPAAMQTRLPGSQVLRAEPFAATFGGKAQRKRPRLKGIDSLEDLRMQAEHAHSAFQDVAEAAIGGSGPGGASAAADAADGFRPLARESLFAKGQSKRIWGELYKVVDSSDVLIQVLDARDPQGTRCAHLEAHLRQRQQRHRTLILLLNKCDLVPAWVTRRWLHTLSREHPTVAFHASVTNPFGRGALMSLLRQLGRLHADKPQLAVGFVGYPNVGKSSVINALRGRKVCVAAPQPGETKVWQYINLTKKICLIDCPGVVWQGGRDTDTDAVLKGVVRVANLADAAEHVSQVLERVKPEYLRRAYKLESWTDSTDFLTKLAQTTGKLLKGGEPDLDTAAKSVLQDWQRGRIPYFAPPPALPENAASAGGDVAPAARAADTAARRSAAQAETQAQALLATAAATAAARQSRRHMPSARGMFGPEDDADPDGDDGGSEEEDGEIDDEDGDVIDGDDDEEEEGGGEEEEEEEEQPHAAGGGHGSDSDDSDGYGELTWDAVVQDLETEQAPSKRGGAAAAGGALRDGKKAKKDKTQTEPVKKGKAMKGRMYTTD